MANKATGALRKLEKQVEAFLTGERKSNQICATKKVARILEKSYPIKLLARESINNELGLYRFKIAERKERKQEEKKDSHPWVMVKDMNEGDWDY